MRSIVANCPNAIQKCPYHGKFEVLNIKGNKDLAIMLPKENFRMTTLIIDGNKNSLNFSLSFIIE
jgi:hypothetical protein